ncbi:hypothetical protein CWS01_14140 [Niallia nealsonii]|uniref:Uncharacterized protein n=1 Tax=Niallia nealsonii TaxID=115979 RepID=A0A2N0YZY8_9BACI|nr:hypothetical protein CWS01_14140 [Niallia nealsonii]
MIGLVVAIIIVNFITIKVHKKQLSYSQILSVYLFSISLQLLFDIFVDFKYHGYWYFTRDIDWALFLYQLFLIPSVNIIFLNLYPFDKPIYIKIATIIIWDIFIFIYECIALLPQPWGYFHYGWWKWWYSPLLNPLLLYILIKYFRLVTKLEKQ